VNFNVLSILSSTGTVLERYGYMPYGQAEVLTASFTADSDGLSDSKNDITFTGQWYDSESRLMLYRHRYYHPVLGTFCSRDPIGYEGSKWNLYEYVGGRALIAVDPRGLDSNGGSAPSGKRCIFVLPEYYAGSFPREEDDVVIDVTDPSTITGSIIDHGCCSLKFIGHQGGSSNAGGTVFQTPEGNVQILGYNGIHEGIRSALQQNKCEKCKIEQVSCSEGDADYWRRRDKFRQYLATYTGCEVVSPLGNPKMFCIEHVKGCKKINAIFPPKQGTRCYSPNPTRPAPKPRLLPGVPYPYPPINLRF
jgi:RHS repeat-associated protein